MQLAKGKFIADSSQGSCRIQAVVQGQRAQTQAVTQIYRVCISGW